MPLIFLIGFLCVSAVAAENFTNVSEKITASITLKNSIHRDAVLTLISESNAVFQTESGPRKVPLSELPEPLRSRFYHPEIATQMKENARAEAAAKAEERSKKKALSESEKTTKINRAVASRQPLRVINGKLYDFTAPFREEETFSKAFALHRFQCARDGTVQQVTRDGLLVKPDKYGGVENQIYLINYPLEASVVDGEYIIYFAILAGRKTYTTVLGGPATVALYDCGVPYDPQKHGNFSTVRKLTEKGEIREPFQSQAQSISVGQ